MRRAASIVLGLLLAFGSTPSGRAHVHVASSGPNSGALHVDHVHFDSGDGSRHSHQADQGAAPELVADHPGDDAVALSLAGSEARPKRELAAFVLPAVTFGSPLRTVARSHDRPAIHPPQSSQPARPPGRAPPA